MYKYYYYTETTAIVALDDEIAADVATKINLKRLENSLDSLAIGIEILKKSIGFYVYYNKPNEHIKTYKIHKMLVRVKDRSVCRFLEF
jgi:hypothetical protein